MGSTTTRGADEGTRTHTLTHENLNLACLPIPSHLRMVAYFGLEPTYLGLCCSYCSTIELHYNMGPHSTPSPECYLLLVITGIVDTVTPVSWRGFVQDFLKPRRLFSALQ